MRMFAEVGLPRMFGGALLCVTLVLILSLLMGSVYNCTLTGFRFGKGNTVVGLMMTLVMLPVRTVVLPLCVRVSRLN